MYVSDKKMSRKDVLAGANAANTSLCWEQSNNILVFDGRNLNRILDNGEIELVCEIDLPFTQSKILAAKSNSISILGAEPFVERMFSSSENRNRIVAGTRPYLVQVNLETKETKHEFFCDPIEVSSIHFSNGNRLLTQRYDYGGKFRFLVLDRGKQNERTIVEVPRQEYKNMFLFDMAPDGRYGICILSHVDGLTSAYALRDSMLGGHKPSVRAWDTIGIITLP